MRIVSTLLLVVLASIITACPATPIAVGKLEVKITGLPKTVASDVTVTGPNKFSKTITEADNTSTGIGTRTIISGLPVGSYSIVANDVKPNDTTYTATVGEGSPVNVSADATTTVNVKYALVPAQ